MISQQESEKLARLCKLKFEIHEVEHITDNINKVLIQANKIEGLGLNLEQDLDNHGEQLALRQDIEQLSLDIEDVFANTKNKRETYFKVPPVIG